MQEPKSWHFDPATERKAASAKDDGKPYKLFEATEKDKQKVLNYYQHHPVSGLEVSSVKVIYNKKFNQRFELQLDTLQQRYNNIGFVAKWGNNDEKDNNDNLEWRAETNKKFEELANPHTDSDYPNVKLVPCWHGTSRGILDSIFRTGYANLATTDSGFFGKGMYGSYEAEYAYRVYGPGAKGVEGVLILNWVAVFSPFPAIHGDMDKLKEKGTYKNYVANFVPVRPLDPYNPNEVNYFPCMPNQKNTYTELVTFESSSVLPRYVVELRPITQILSIPQTISTKPNVNSQQAQNSPIAKKDDGKVEYETGVCYEKGHGLIQDDYQAAKYFRLSADKGNADACYALGHCYIHGKGVILDCKQAEKYYKISADKGNVKAQVSLACLYGNGYHLTQDDDKQAVKYFRLAANQGDAYAQYALGVCYADGQGVAQNYKEAEKYYNLAAANGNENAKIELKLIQQKAQGNSQNTAINPSGLSPNNTKQNILPTMFNNIQSPKSSEIHNQKIEIKQSEIISTNTQTKPNFTINSSNSLQTSFGKNPYTIHNSSLKPDSIISTQQFEQQNQFIKALLSGNFESVKNLENQGVSFLCAGSDGCYPLAAAVYGCNLEIVNYVEKKLKNDATEQWAKVDIKQYTNKLEIQMPTPLSKNATYGELANWYEKYKNAMWCVTYDQKVLKEMGCVKWGSGDGGWTIGGGRGKRLMLRMEKDVVMDVGLDVILYSPSVKVHEDVVKVIREQLNELKSYVAIRVKSTQSQIQNQKIESKQPEKINQDQADKIEIKPPREKHNNRSVFFPLKPKHESKKTTQEPETVTQKSDRKLKKLGQKNHK